MESNQLNNEPVTPAEAPTIEINDKALKLVTEQSVQSANPLPRLNLAKAKEIDEPKIKPALSKIASESALLEKERPSTEKIKVVEQLPASKEDIANFPIVNGGPISKIPKITTSNTVQQSKQFVPSKPKPPPSVTNQHQQQPQANEQQLKMIYTGDQSNRPPNQTQFIQSHQQPIHPMEV